MNLRSDIGRELPRLHAHARKLCMCESDALDLVQDTVVRALAYEDSFEPGTNLRAWLQQILRSVFVTGYRRGSRERRALERLAADPCSWPHRDSPPSMAALAATAQGALERLPDPFRRVVELVDLGGFEYRDAAQTLDVPVGTVMSRLHRARRLLATRLGDTEQRAA